MRANTTTVKKTVIVNTAMVVINKVSTITVENKTIKVGDIFDSIAGVTANDDEDENLTVNIIVIENTVNTDNSATYTIKYEVTDSDSAKANKTIYVTLQNIPTKGKLVNHNIETLPQTGTPFSLPLLGGILIALASVLNVYKELSDTANINGITGMIYYVALKTLIEN